MFKDCLSLWLMKLLKKITQPDSTGEHEAWLMECSCKHQFICDEVLLQNCERIRMVYQSALCGPIPYWNIRSICPECGSDSSEITPLDVVA